MPQTIQGPMSKMFGDSFKQFDQYFFQKIGVNLTVTAGNTETATVTLPKDVTGFLVAYGYSWFTSTTFQLNTGRAFMPARTDQDGSPAIPMVFANPIPIEQGGQVQLRVTNGDSADHTYYIVFQIYSSRMLDVTSSGSDLSIPGTSGSGVATAVAIVDQTATAYAPVDSTLGLTVNAASPATLRAANASATAVAAALAASTSIKWVMIQAAPTNTDFVMFGTSAAQPFRLDPGQWSPVMPISNLAQVYILANSGTQTVNYVAA